jgi:uncharacterized protein YjbI with pentapeptide repeats
VRISLSSSKAQGANFSGALLTGADFREADIAEAQFGRAYLTDANFAGALNAPSFELALLCKTVLPDGKVAAPSC